MLSASEVLKHVFGYDVFRRDQEAIVEHIIGSGDALILMPTGAGKSLCYQIPGLVRRGVAVVVSPLVALMHDQVDALRALGVSARACMLGLGGQKYKPLSKHSIIRSSSFYMSRLSALKIHAFASLITPEIALFADE